MSQDATQSNVVLQVDNLESYYGPIMAIRGVSLRVQEGSDCNSSGSKWRG